MVLLLLLQLLLLLNAEADRDGVMRLGADTGATG